MKGGFGDYKRRTNKRSRVPLLFRRIAEQIRGDLLDLFVGFRDEMSRKI